MAAGPGGTETSVNRMALFKIQVAGYSPFSPSGGGRGGADLFIRHRLQRMRTPVGVILGGKYNGNDYSEILPLVREKVKAIVCMGKDNSKLLDFFGNEGKEICDCHSLPEAVSACRRLAADGDTVLLSPCCASFDLFESYEDRGRRFKEAVNNL